MQRNIFIVIFCLSLCVGLIPSPWYPELYVYAPYNLQLTANVATVQVLIDRASAAGYTGIIIIMFIGEGLVLADFKFSIIHTGILVPQYYVNLRNVINYAQSKGMTVMPSICFLL